MNIKEVLENACGTLTILTGEDISADFTHDELPGGADYMPDAVVEAKSTEEVAAVLAACHGAGVPVTVRGAGTGQAGGSVALCGGVVLSVKGMNQILALDAENKTVTVQPGVLLQNVKAEAEKRDLEIGYDRTIGYSLTTPTEAFKKTLEENGYALEVLFARAMPEAKAKADREKPHKYFCTCCGQEVKTTADLSLICGVCEVPMERVG